MGVNSVDVEGVKVDVGKFTLNELLPDHALAPDKIPLPVYVASAYAFVIRSVEFAGVTVLVGKYVLNSL